MINFCWSGGTQRNFVSPFFSHSRIPVHIYIFTSRILCCCVFRFKTTRASLNEKLHECNQISIEVRCQTHIHEQHTNIYSPSRSLESFIRDRLNRENAEREVNRKRNKKKNVMYKKSMAPSLNNKRLLCKFENLQLIHRLSLTMKKKRAFRKHTYQHRVTINNRKNNNADKNLPIILEFS